MTNYSGQAKTNLEIDESSLTINVAGKQKGQFYCNNAFQHINDHDQRAPCRTENAIGVGGTCIAASVVTNIKIKEIFANPDRSWNTANEICKNDNE